MSKRFVESLPLCVVLALAGCSSSPPVEHTKAAPSAPRRLRWIANPKRCSNKRSPRFRRSATTEAESLLKELTARDPLLSGPWVNLGGCTKRWATTMPQARVQEGDRREPRQLRGVCRSRRLVAPRRRFSERRSELSCVHARVPNFREAYLNLGILYELYLGRLDDALQAYQTYQTLSEQPGHARRRLGIRSRAANRRKRIMKHVVRSERC